MVVLKVKKIVIVLFFVLNYFFSNGQDNKQAELKNEFSFSVINSINSVIKTKSDYFKQGTVKPTYSTSGAIFYQRMRSEKFGLLFGLGYENQKIKRNNVLARKVYLDRNGNITISEYYIDETMSNRGYITVNFTPIYRLYKTKNVSFYTLLGVSYNFLAVESQKYGLNYCSVCDYNYDVMPEKNFKLNLGLKIDYLLSKKISLECRPFYDVFLSKSVFNLHYYSFGANIGLGYKW